MPDWSDIFALTMDPAELVIRGTAVYWLLFLLLRFVLRRDVGSIGVADVLLIVLLADASQNAMAGDYESVGDGAVLVSTIAAWNWAIDAVSFHVPAIRRLLEAQPIALVRDGKLLSRNMRKEFITRDEIMAALHKEGLERLDQVKVATMESDGEISVIKRD